MARIRTLKPELASDVKLASVSRDARYTFVLLITQSDDEGLVAAAHRQLLGALYPHDDAVTTAQMLGWIEELVGIDLLQWRATHDGAPVLEIVNWSKHQRVDNKSRSQLAKVLAPPEPEDNLAEFRGEPPHVAEFRGLDLGPRTIGPTTMEKEPRASAHDAAATPPAESSRLENAKRELLALLSDQPDAALHLNVFLAGLSDELKRYSWALNLKTSLQPISGGRSVPSATLVAAMADFNLAERTQYPYTGAAFRAFVDRHERDATTGGVRPLQRFAGPGMVPIGDVLDQWARETDAREQVKTSA